MAQSDSHPARKIRVAAWRVKKYHERSKVTIASHRLGRGVLDGDSMEREILVTGCGSSGTSYLAALLNLNGVAVTHDQHLGRSGIVTNAVVNGEVWVYEFHRHNNKNYVIMKLPADSFEHIIHLVRHPLQVIGSVQEKWKDWGEMWPHITAGMKSADFDNSVSLRSACIYWLEWNEMIEKIATSRFTIEQITVDPKPLFDTLGKKLKHTLTANRVGSSGVDSYPEWSDLDALDPTLSARIVAKAQGYGYHI